MIAIPASLRSDFIHIAGTGFHIALESTIHITGIATPDAIRASLPLSGGCRPGRRDFLRWRDIKLPA
jgi:hypothetical protein